MEQETKTPSEVEAPPSKSEKPHEHETKFDYRLWQRFITLAKPYWFLDKKWSARGLMFLLVLLMLAYTYLSVVSTQQTGEFTSALTERNKDRFWKAIYLCIGVLLIFVPVNAFYYYVRDKLAVNWRQWLTNRFIDSYFNNRAFYKLSSSDEIDNPDQRITEDINTFTQKSLYFLLIIIEQMMQLVAFSGVLWSISHRLVIFLIVYAVVGTLITTIFFGKALIGLNYYQLQREGDFRYRLVRVRENAESIAMYQGESNESDQIKESFNEGYINFNKLLRAQLRLNLFQYGYSSLTAILPGVILADQVMSGEMEIGKLIIATSAFVVILKAVSMIVDKFDSLSQFAAGIDRLDAFASALSMQSRGRLKIKSKYFKSRRKNISLTNVTLMTPNLERTLVKNVTLSIKPGDGLLIVGPSGGGKSSLLRGIAGLWNAGSGYILRPKPKEMLFLSQRSYMVMGTLRNQLFYPNKDNPSISDAELAEILKKVNLPDLLERIGGFDIEVDWAKLLSLGEQQRIAFARVLLTKPRYVLLDEATSALDIPNEDNLYQLLADTSITMISVSHRPSTLKFHTHVLELLDDGRWTIHKAEDFKFDTTLQTA
jgi:putative ATP-binding cassette transporter